MVKITRRNQDVYNIIKERKPRTVAQIASIMKISKPSTAAHIKRLIKAGWITDNGIGKGFTIVPDIGRKIYTHNLADNAINASIRPVSDEENKEVIRDDIKAEKSQNDTISDRQYKLLELLSGSKGEKATFSMLSKQMELPSHAIVSCFNSLCNKGYLEHREKEDGIDVYTITQKSKDLMEAREKDEIDKQIFEVVENAKYKLRQLHNEIDEMFRGTLERTFNKLDELLPNDGDKLPMELFKKVEELELSVRSANALRLDRITYIGELIQKSEQEMLRTPNFGRKSLSELKEILKEMGLSFHMDFPDWEEAIEHLRVSGE